MELICKIDKFSRDYYKDFTYRHFWGSVIVGTKDKKPTDRPKKAHIFLRSLISSYTDDDEEIIQWFSSVESLKVGFQNEYTVSLYSEESPYNISITNVPPARLKTFVNYIQELSRQDTSKLKLPSASDVARSVFQLPISLMNVNDYQYDKYGEDEYFMKVELTNNDLEHVICLSIVNCSLTTPIGREKIKNLRSLWLRNIVIGSSDVLEVESRELKELRVHECELQFEIRSLFQNNFNFIDSLTELYLDHNQLSQLPDGIFQFRNLLNLSLMDNRLKQLPDTFSKLPKLNMLSLYKNQLEYLPFSLVSLKLDSLNVADNNFVYDNIEPETSSKNIHSLKELTYRTILNNKLVLKEDEKLPKLLRETLVNHHQCLCGSKFINEGQAVSLLFHLPRITNGLSNLSSNYGGKFPLRGVVCSSLTECWFRRFQNFEINSSWRCRDH